jgi:probable F420-dependent oxidoreductase
VSYGISFGAFPGGVPTDPTFIPRFGKHVEHLGFDRMFIGDHIFGQTTMYDSFTVLSHVAALTQHIQLGVGVAIMPLRDPVITAKTAATLDILSEGRFVLGVGVGGEVAHEWRAMAVDMGSRGRRTDEYIEVMRRCWTGEPIDFDGEFRQIHGVFGAPLPFTPGGPKIWIGGRSDSAIRRATRNDGYYCYLASPRRIRESVARIDELFGGQHPESFKVVTTLRVLMADSKEAARERARSGEGYAQEMPDAMLDSLFALGTEDDVAERIAAYDDTGVEYLNCALVFKQPDEFFEQAERIAKFLGLTPRGEATSNV